MNNEDMSDIIQKLSSMMNNSIDNSEICNDTDISSNSNKSNFEDLQSILSNFNNNNENDNNSQQNNTFNMDFETILKIKKAMDIFNSNKNSPETNLLLSLKPYLNKNRKQKLDQYIQFLNISKIIEAFNSNGGVNNNDVSK